MASPAGRVRRHRAGVTCPCPVWLCRSFDSAQASDAAATGQTSHPLHGCGRGLKRWTVVGCFLRFGCVVFWGWTVVGCWIFAVLSKYKPLSWDVRLHSVTSFGRGGARTATIWNLEQEQHGFRSLGSISRALYAVLVAPSSLSSFLARTIGRWPCQSGRPRTARPGHGERTGMEVGWSRWRWTQVGGVPSVCFFEHLGLPVERSLTKSDYTTLF